jgi:hypothetical protein
MGVTEAHVEKWVSLQAPVRAVPMATGYAPLPAGTDACGCQALTCVVLCACAAGDHGGADS